MLIVYSLVCSRWNKVCGDTPETLIHALVPDQSMFSFIGGVMNATNGGAGPGNGPMAYGNGSQVLGHGRGSGLPRSPRQGSTTVASLGRELSYATFSQGMVSTGG